MRRTCHKPAHANPFGAQRSGLSGRNDIARLASRSLSRTQAHAPPCAEWFDPSRGCVHTRAGAGMSRQTSAQLLSTCQCALDQTPAALLCGLVGFQDHAPTVLKYWEYGSTAGGGRDIDCVNYPHLTAVPAARIIRMLRPHQPTSRTLRQGWIGRDRPAASTGRSMGACTCVLCAAVDLSISVSTSSTPDYPDYPEYAAVDPSIGMAEHCALRMCILHIGAIQALRSSASCLWRSVCRTSTGYASPSGRAALIADGAVRVLIRALRVRARY